MKSRRMLRAALVFLVGCAPASSQMRLSDVQPGMERDKVIREMSKQYPQEEYKLDNSGESSSVTRWIEKDGKVISVRPLGIVLYKAGRVDIVEEYYDDRSTKDATELVRSLVDELRGHLKPEIPIKGHPSRHAATARILLDEFTDPESGQSNRSIFVMFGGQGIRMTLTDWKGHGEAGSYVELARRREASP